MLNRQMFEERELRELAPFAAKSARGRGRLYPEAEHPYRTAYQRDRDRIVHCTAFRRLEYKTQVFLTHEGDYFRTRLTHTLEVAQIARTIARALNLNEDLTEAAALAHDLGHTPFGHSGEEALAELMKDRGGFEHNRHAVRIIDFLEHPYPQFRGLNLTWEVRECIAKHATAYDRPLVGGFGPGCPPLEGQAVEMADSIAYDSHDLDDALAMRIVSAEDLQHLTIFRQAATDFEKTLADLTLDQRTRRIAKLLIDLMVGDLVTTSERAIEQAHVRSVDDVPGGARAAHRVFPATPAEARGVRAVPPQDRLPPLSHRTDDDQGQAVHRDDLRGVPREPCQLPPQYQAQAETEGLHVAICDYIAGMTDRYAQDEYQRLYEPFERV